VQLELPKNIYPSSSKSRRTICQKSVPDHVLISPAPRTFLQRDPAPGMARRASAGTHELFDHQFHHPREARARAARFLAAEAAAGWPWTMLWAPWTMPWAASDQILDAGGVHWGKLHRCLNPSPMSLSTLRSLISLPDRAYHGEKLC
jgi:hypothetical protein